MTRIMPDKQKKSPHLDAYTLAVEARSNHEYPRLARIPHATAIRTACGQARSHRFARMLNSPPTRKEY